MSKRFFQITCLAVLSACLVVSACSDKKLANNPGISTNPIPQYRYSFTVVSGDAAVGQAMILGIFSDKVDTVLSCDLNGQAQLESELALQSALAMAPGKSGVLTTVVEGENTVNLESVDTVAVQSPPIIATDYVFGVYDTDGNGDVRFRYRYSFRYFYCSSWLPAWPIGDPNPNHWMSWQISDFSSPWLGKKLLVPRRYQLWHQTVYGRSISRALFLVSSL